MTAPSPRGNASWLEIVEGDAPLLLIAPHGGHAGAAARATLHPKVNDLETAEITREIAARLRARALINAAMDRNELDCNRLSQIRARAPWLLELIAEQVGAIVQNAGYAIVLLIHGWNIIEPRVDLGLGLREIAGALRPPSGAHVTATDRFIQGSVSVLAARLRDAQIHPTFGLRYPGGAAHNLLQGFTARHAGSNAAPLRQLATIASQGLLNAMQLEMSVAVRLPGELRQRAIDAITDTFAQNGGLHRTGLPARASRPVPIIRHRAPSSSGEKSVSAPPSRVGIEFYDPVARLGGMVSYDFGPGAAGGRIMILFEGGKVALFTAEGKAERNGDRLSLGPLTLNASPGGRLNFCGPTVIVDDGTAYLSVERALARSRLDRRTEIEATLEFDGAAASFNEILIELDELFSEARGAQLQPKELSLLTPPHAAFGRLHGAIGLNGRIRSCAAYFRLGASFTGLGPQKFITRRMVWANFFRNRSLEAFEARELELDDGSCHRIARVFRNDRWANCSLGEIRINPAPSLSMPESIAADVTHPDGARLSIEGRPGTFVMLSRPGPDGTRLQTTLGFAEFRTGDFIGAGMYEFSRRIGLSCSRSDADNGGEEPES
ncbi:MAG: hypothetical protein JO166_03220 [Deltaproteobacteria bacterium]|nr:hypothetical protein [Deltaproteobacteria bacterium]